MDRPVRSLPPNLWPEADRRAWQGACRPGERLARGGCASQLKPITRADLARRYGYLLDFCERTGGLDLAAPAAAHVRPDILDPFLEELRARVSSVTCHGTIYKIRRFAVILAPTTDFGWLREIERDLDLEKVPHPKHDRIVNARLLVEAGLTRMQENQATARAGSVNAATRYRDGLMVALLGCCPIRLKNLASLSLGRQIRDIDGAWRIVLPASETKTNRHDERPVPAFLAPRIATWLELRETVLNATSPGFWIGRGGAPLSYLGVEGAIARTTRASLGRAIYPHLFRDCAVQLVASEAGERMGIASATLQHADPKITEAHYNKGAMVEAARAYECLLGGFVVSIEDGDGEGD
ncbi:site-specific integrase [Stappia sp. GBMRC 2046]|uniref:Site-specific integrase n=1 Tax=Stappia sediminis TaxID=2692190 RepID=A0A7X3S6E3_9HYPH|nr:site-specific integrase [Stappia sediminis]MXN63869.1 site-specific integrase [Stappia sediminis]